jgi:hypothetical protein
MYKNIPQSTIQRSSQTDEPRDTDSGGGKTKGGFAMGAGGPQTSEWHDRLSFVSVNTWHMPRTQRPVLLLDFGDLDCLIRTTIYNSN